MKDVRLSTGHQVLAVCAFVVVLFVAVAGGVAVGIAAQTHALVQELLSNETLTASMRDMIEKRQLRHETLLNRIGFTP